MVPKRDLKPVIRECGFSRIPSFRKRTSYDNAMGTREGFMIRLLSLSIQYYRSLQME